MDNDVVYVYWYMYLVPVNLFIQVHEMLDLDPASWAALVAQLVRASVRSAECRGFKSHLRQLIFSFFICLRCLSFFLSFFSSQIIMYYIIHVQCIYIHIRIMMWYMCTGIVYMYIHTH